MRRVIYIILILVSEQAFAINDHAKLEVLQSLISKNQRYSKETPPDSIIIWGEQLEPALLGNKQYQELFEVKYLVAQTHAMRGDISLAIDKAHTMSEEARLLNYDPGLVLASQAIGDTYLYANMPDNAISSYKQALQILDNQVTIEVFRERLLTRLLQALMLGDNLLETHHYLVQLNRLIPEKETGDPLYIYRLMFNSFYNIRMGLLDEAGSYLKQTDKYLSEYTISAPPQLAYIQALYHEKTGNDQAALAEYEQLLPILLSEFSPFGQELIIQNYAGLLVKLERAEDACKLYKEINNRKDSLSVKSYTRQINRLHEDYQIDTIALENQTEKNYLTRLAIAVGGCIMLLSFLLASYVRRSNKKLARSKENLEQAKRQAEASTRSKSMFLSNMSHEIRTPLNALSGFSAILTEESIDNETRLQCTEIIQQNSELLLKLINDVIDLSSLEFGKMQFNFKDSDAIVVCRNVVEMVQKIKQTKADILFDTPLETLILHTDDARLQQVLINLLINATKFTPSGSITLGLTKQSDNMALFTVSDTGCGIPLENQKKIFKRFEKLDEQDQGTGLGLSICQLIIKHIGGEFWIDPEYTEGSRFCFTHPINKKEA